MRDGPDFNSTILIVTAQLDHGGLETRLRGELCNLRARGARIILATGADETVLESIGIVVDRAYCDLPFRRALNVSLLKQLVAQLAGIIESEEVDEIWGHPFVSIFPAMLAGELKGCARRLVLHGPVSLSDQEYGVFWNLVLRQFMLPHAEQIISVSRETDALAHEASFAPLRHSLIMENGIDTAVYRPTRLHQPVRRRILVVSRLDRPRIRAIMPLLKLLQPFQGWSIDFAGDGVALARLKRAVRLYGYSPERVRYLGVRHDIAQLQGEYDVIAANGRAFLEGASANKFCVLIGPEAPPFLVRKADFEELRRANYSGRGISVSRRDLSHDFKNIDTLDPEDFMLRDMVLEYADERRIANGLQPLKTYSSETPICKLADYLLRDVDFPDVAVSRHPKVLRRLRGLPWSAEASLAFQDYYIDFLEASRKELNDKLWKAQNALAKAVEASQ
ncbi:glycosyltransferase [Henriciella sp.]|uniref:glycosyltransferase n=1 Tax=Henriciella sp. TaxID=1968823 RepID=UPI00261CA0F6|nr:glycosyltransferase [Henriciella sp.]